MIVRYHERALQDVAEATRYYASIRIELARELRAELDAAVNTILSDPLRFEQVRPGIRRYLVRRFPYGVYYRTPDADTVQVIVVKHHRRRPGYGMRRK